MHGQGGDITGGEPGRVRGLQGLEVGVEIDTEEMNEQQADVFPTRAQRRESDVDAGLEAVEQRLVEAPCGERGLEICVGSGDDENVHLSGPGAAERLDDAVFNHPQEHRLSLQRQIADLVDEEGAAVGGAEKARLTVGSARERSSFVAEEHVVCAFPLKAAGVLGDERTFRARAALVQSAGDQLFTRAAFAPYEDCVGSARGPRDRVANVVYRVTRPDETKVRGAGDRAANTVQAESERTSNGHDDAASKLCWIELTRLIEPLPIDANLDVGGPWPDLETAL
jgi:hypothetical protein